MKLLFLILAVVCYAQTYTPVFNKEMQYCKEIKFVEGFLNGGTPAYTCTSCFEGYKLDSGKCVLNTLPFPAYLTTDINTGTNKIAYHSLGSDEQDGTCSSTIKIVYASRDEDVTSDENYATPCLACADYETGSSSKCKTCASGYIMKGGNCVPQSISPFPQDDDYHSTNAKCYNGEYSEGNAKCYLCSDESTFSNYKCEPKSFDIENCLKVYLAYGVPSCEECLPGHKWIEEEQKCVESGGDNCLIPGDYDESAKQGKCSKCQRGYKPNPTQTSCTKCTYDLKDTYVNSRDDYCFFFSQQECGVCDPNCVYDTVNSRCRSMHCDLFTPTDICVRCEDGYSLVGPNCVKNEFEGFSGEYKDSCLDGYYMAVVDKQGETVKKEGETDKIEYVCLPCKGNCKTCADDKYCIETNDDNGSGRSKVGHVILDPYCERPNPYDPSTCLECKENSKLIGGRCYQFGKPRSNMAGETIGVCDYYETPAFVTDISVTPPKDFVKSYVKKSETYYVRDNSKIDEDYLCDYHESIPYYYKYVDGTFSCRGANRDPNNDCECVEGYYPSDVLKTSDCAELKFVHCDDPSDESTCTTHNFKRCEKALAINVCAKCKSPFQLNYVYNDDYTYRILECGCPDGQKISCTDDEGNDCTCVACEKANCATCRTNSDGNEQCLSCRGTDASLFEVDYNRDKKKDCECLDNTYASYQDNDVNACYKFPEVCNNLTPDGQSQPNNGANELQKYGYVCTKCNDEGKHPTHWEGACMNCLDGYYYQEDAASQNNFKCLQCPTVTVNGKPIEYCSLCEKDTEGKVKCTECVDYSLDVDQNCQGCVGGDNYIVVNQYTDASKKDVIPHCVKCPQYCATPTTSEGKIDKNQPLCFYSKSDGTEYNNDKTNSKTTIYPSDLKDYNLFCSVCKGDNKDPKSHCECSGQTYNDEGICEDCHKAFKNGKEKFCDFTPSQGNSDEKTCPVDPKTGYIQCIKCATDYNARTEESNCTKCEGDNMYPSDIAEDHGCSKCPDECNECYANKEGKPECRYCDDPETKPPYCNVCSDGFYRKPGIKCSSCDSQCKICTGEKFNCSVCQGQRLPWDSSLGVPPFYFSDEVSVDKQNNRAYYGCISCKEGYYYNFNLKDCSPISTETRLLKLSVGSCVKKHDSIEGVPDRGDDERGKVTAIEDCSSEDAIGFEWALSCNNEYDPLSSFKYEEYKKGMMEHAVNGECVCKQGYIDTRTKSQILGNHKNVEAVGIPLCTDVRIATGVDFCTSAEFSGYEEKEVYVIVNVPKNKTITPATTSFDEFGTIDVIEKVYLPIKIDGTDDFDILVKDYIATQTLDSLFKKCNGNCIVTYLEEETQQVDSDFAPTFKCTKCNSDYLELDETTGKCVCKSGYYQTSWGMCVPCNRHISGCSVCKRDDSIPVDDSVKGHERLQVKCSKCENGKSPTEEGKC